LANSELKPLRTGVGNILHVDRDENCHSFLKLAQILVGFKASLVVTGNQHQLVMHASGFKSTGTGPDLLH